MRGRQARLTHVLGVLTRVTLRSGSAFSHRRLRGDLGEDSGLEGLSPGGGSSELYPRGRTPQAFLSRAAALPPPLQDHLRDGRGAQRGPDGTEVSAVRGFEGARGSGRCESAVPAPGTGGCDTLVQRAGLLRAPGAARRIPVSTRGRGNGIYGTRKMDPGVTRPNLLESKPLGLPPRPCSSSFTFARRGVAAPAPR